MEKTEEGPGMRDRKRERWGEGFGAQRKGRWLVPERRRRGRGARWRRVGHGLEQAGMCSSEVNESSMLATHAQVLISGSMLLHFVFFNANGAKNNLVLF